MKKDAEHQEEQQQPDEQDIKQMTSKLWHPRESAGLLGWTVQTQHRGIGPVLKPYCFAVVMVTVSTVSFCVLGSIQGHWLPDPKKELHKSWEEQQRPDDHESCSRRTEQEQQAEGHQQGKA